MPNVTNSNASEVNADPRSRAALDAATQTTLGCPDCNVAMFPLSRGFQCPRCLEKYDMCEPGWVPEHSQFAYRIDARIDELRLSGLSLLDAIDAASREVSPCA